MTLELLTTDNESQWFNLVNIIPNIKKKEIKPFVILSLKELQGKPDARMQSISQVDHFSAVRAVVRHMVRLRSALKVPYDSTEVHAFLQGLRFSEDCIIELNSLMNSSEIYSGIPQHVACKPRITDVQWKIDISLSQVSTCGVTDDTVRQLIHRDTFVVLTLGLSDGSRRTFCLSIPRFHELRYTIATMLKQMLVLERRKCMQN